MYKFIENQHSERKGQLFGRKAVSPRWTIVCTSPHICRFASHVCSTATGGGALLDARSYFPSLAAAHVAARSAPHLRNLRCR